MKIDFSLKAKLAILSIIPLCCAIGLGASMAMERITALRQFSSFDEVMKLANNVADVNEANNTELGNAWRWTATAVNENGVEVVQKIRETWTANGKALDDAYASLVKIRELMDLSKYDPRLKTILGEVDEAKAKLAEHRQRMHEALDYSLIIQPYNELKTRIQALYPPC